MTANDYELFRQFFRISIEHRTPNATLGTGHPDFSEQGIYLEQFECREGWRLARQARRVERIDLHQENKKQELQVYLEQEIPSTDVKRIYMTEIQDSGVVEEVQLQTMQLQNALLVAS
ncbi:uncharacterized protein PITG_20708 [Phytophthora infestans T30-4]|uniref:Uncharacterized protein n=1 Tax=Phytophthora infestans (strain T30-4) TaxID=403677 RepID=D0P343_PHYIT|nr:uncharacterized protein PITG_20708 [Phytophthora infestans T30-4]EEY59016.1 conserved hypothetical protein [Phytophthora infestans T30-4]|eukprot:XP_002895274.1 conserved hypothetical protein [Phytophthora infestans T30-4]